MGCCGSFVVGELKSGIGVPQLCMAVLTFHVVFYPNLIDVHAGRVWNVMARRAHGPLWKLWHGQAGEPGAARRRRCCGHAA